MIGKRTLNGDLRMPVISIQNRVLVTNRVTISRCLSLLNEAPVRVTPYFVQEAECDLVFLDKSGQPLATLQSIAGGYHFMSPGAWHGNVYKAGSPLKLNPRDRARLGHRVSAHMIQFYPYSILPTPKGRKMLRDLLQRAAPSIVLKEPHPVEL